MCTAIEHRQKGNTPLHLAARDPYNTEIVDVLCGNGADINLRNRRDETPLMIACQTNAAPVALALIRHGADANIPDEVCVSLSR